MKEKIVETTIRLPKGLHEHIRRLAFERKVSMHSLILNSVQAAIDNRGHLERRIAALETALGKISATANRAKVQKRAPKKRKKIEKHSHGVCLDGLLG